MSGLIFVFCFRLNIGFFSDFGVVNSCEPAGRSGGWSGGWGRDRGRDDTGCGVWVLRGFVVGKFFVVDSTVLLVEVLPSLSWVPSVKLDLQMYIVVGHIYIPSFPRPVPLTSAASVPQ